MWTELSNLRVGLALGGSAYPGMSNVSFRATHGPGAGENWSVTVAGQEKPLSIMTLQTQPLNDARLHSKQSVKSQQTKGRGVPKEKPRSHFMHQEKCSCIHPPTAAVDKKQEQVLQCCSIPQPPTGTGLSQGSAPALQHRNDLGNLLQTAQQPRGWHRVSLETQSCCHTDTRVSRLCLSLLCAPWKSCWL